jgi:hypothetical protein
MKRMAKTSRPVIRRGMEAAPSQSISEPDSMANLLKSEAEQ